MKVTDQVCGMSIDSEKAYATEDHQGQTYYFCSTQCHGAFKANPEKFAAKAKAGAGGSGHGGQDHD